MFSLIAAVDINGGIAKDGRIPWHFSLDMRFFKEKTLNSMVIMGRKTWETLPGKLPNRINVVISREYAQNINYDIAPDYTFPSIKNFLVWCFQQEDVKMHKYVIGGAEIYKEFLDMGLISTCFITHIYKDYTCDQFIDLLHIINHESHILYEFTNDEVNLCIMKYIIGNTEEQNMLKLIKNIKKHGFDRVDRTGVGNRSIFGADLTFSLRKHRFPLMTYRKLPIRHIFEELMWILRGQTDNQVLKSKKINIWTPNSTREFLDKRGLGQLREGDIGSTYGFNMRHFGANYEGCDADYNGLGFDQLAYVIDLLKNNPTDRRIIISLWDPNSLKLASLPACMYNYQFYVAGRYLSCKATQRSSDIMLAGGWNVAFAALLTILLAKSCGLKPDKLIWSVGDVHIYNNQLDIVDGLVSRYPNVFPVIYVPKKENILDYKYSDLELIGYNPHPNIVVPFNV